MNIQKYATGQLYTAGAVNQEQKDASSAQDELISSLLINDKCILGENSLVGTIDNQQLSISSGTAYIKNDVVSKVVIKEFIREAQVSKDKYTVVTKHNIKNNTMPKVYKPNSLYDLIELENVGEGDGVLIKFPLKYVSTGLKQDTSVYINDVLMDGSSWNFTDWPDGGQMNKGITFIASPVALETTNASLNWDLAGKTLSFELFNQATLTNTRIDVLFSGNGKSTLEVSREINQAIETAMPGSPYLCDRTEASRLLLTSGYNTGFDMRLRVLPCSAIINTGGGTYLGFDKEQHTGSGEVTKQDLVYASYKKEFINYALTLDGNKTVTCNDLTNSDTDNPHVPVIVEYEADLNIYYGNVQSLCIAQLPPVGMHRYDIVYVEPDNTDLYDKTYFFNDETLVPYQKYAYVRNIDSYVLSVFSSVAAEIPTRINMANFYAAHPNAIPVFETYVSSSGVVSVNNNTVGDINGAVGASFTRVSDYRLKLPTVEELRKKKFEVPFKKALSLTSGASTVNLELDVKNGYALIDGYASIATPAGEPVYRTSAGEPAPEALANLIFAKITNSVPGAEQATLYRGDPEGSNAPFVTSRAETLVCTYYLLTTAENIPSDIYKRVTTAGLAVYDGGAVTELGNHLNDTAASLFNVDQGDVAFHPLIGKIKWSSMSVSFRNTNGSGFNSVTESTIDSEFSPIQNEYVYLLLNRAGATVDGNTVKHSLDPWGASPGREYDVVILGQLTTLNSVPIFVRAKHGRLWTDVRSVYSSANMTKSGRIKFCSGTNTVTWESLELTFRGNNGKIKSNVVTASAPDTRYYIAPGRYLFAIIERSSSTQKTTVYNDKLYTAEDPWGDLMSITNRPSVDLDVVIFGFCAGSTAPYTFIQTFNHSDKCLLEDDWVVEQKPPLRLVGNNAVEIDEDLFGSKAQVYKRGRFVRIQTADAYQYYYCQVHIVTVIDRPGIWDGLRVTFVNVRDKNGNTTTMPADDIITSFEYSAVQMQYMGTINDINPINKSLADHVSDAAIHTSYRFLFKTEDLTVGIGAGGANMSFTLADEYAAGTLAVYVNGLLLMPSEFTETSLSAFTVIKTLVPEDTLIATFIIHGQDHTYIFNENITSQRPGSVFTIANNFYAQSMQVYRNGAKLLAKVTPNGFQVTALNQITLQTPLEAWETLVVHYDKTGDESIVVFNEDVSVQAPGYTFSVEFTFLAKSVMVFRNGVLVRTEDGINDYYISGTRAITFAAIVEPWESVVITYNKQMFQIDEIAQMSDVSFTSLQNSDKFEYSTVLCTWTNVRNIHYTTMIVKAPSLAAYLALNIVPKDGTVTSVRMRCLTNPNLSIVVNKTNSAGTVSAITNTRTLNNQDWSVATIASGSLSKDDVVSLEATAFTSGTNLVVEIGVTFS
jgi:hypothetical protein